MANKAAKITLEEIEKIVDSEMRDNAPAAKKLKDALRRKASKLEADAEAAREEAKAQAGPEAKAKKRLFAIQTEPGTVFLVEAPDSQDGRTVVQHVIEVATLFNQTKKGRKDPISTLGNTFMDAPAKLWKAAGFLTRKSKEPVEIVEATNALPGSAMHGDE